MQTIPFRPLPRFHAVSLLLLALGLSASGADAVPNIAVALPPQAGILKALLPDAVPIVLIDRGQNPHSFDPTPRQLAALSRASLYVAAGLPFETALRERLRALNPAMRLIEPPPDDEDDHDDGDAHSHEDGHDPHFWTHPDGILAEARAVAGTLSETAPATAPDLAAALAAYEARLREADARLRKRLAPFQGRAFLVYHPAWSHFAEAYGLRQLAVEHHGGAPSPRHLAALVDTVRAEGIQAILVQSDSEAARAAPLANSLSLAIRRVNALDPDPIALLEATAEAVEAALGGEPPAP